MLHRLSSAARQIVPSRVFWLLILILVATRLPCLNNPLLDHFSFRQTQTALTSYWYTQEGINLVAYPLPLFGRPWTVPFEFPTYQLIVSALNTLGMRMDVAARLSSVLIFTAAVILAARLLFRLKATPTTIGVFTVLCTISPFAIVWSRACLIDYTSVLLAIAYLSVCNHAATRRWSLGCLTAALVAGILASTTKITTLPVFWTASALLAADHLWRIWSAKTSENPDEPSKLKSLLIPGCQWTLVLLLPIVASRLEPHD